MFFPLLYSNVQLLGWSFLTKRSVPVPSLDKLRVAPGNASLLKFLTFSSISCATTWEIRDQRQCSIYLFLIKCQTWAYITYLNILINLIDSHSFVKSQSLGLRIWNNVFGSLSIYWYTVYQFTLICDLPVKTFRKATASKKHKQRNQRPPKNYNKCMLSPAKVSFLGTISQAVTLSSSSVTAVILGHLMGFFL